MSRQQTRLQKLEERIAANNSGFSHLSDEQLDAMGMNYWKETAKEYGITPNTSPAELANAVKNIWLKYP